MRKSVPFLAAALLAAASATAVAQTRYAPPPQLVLSPDLASPWILQLRTKPVGDGRYAVEISRGVARAPVYAPVDGPAFRTIRAGYEAAAPAPRWREPAAAVVTQKSAAKAEKQFDPRYEMQMVDYPTPQAPGTLIIDTQARFLYLVEGDGLARRYGIGVGRPGFEWAGTRKITRKSEWPDWNPPSEMIAREARRGKIIPKHMEGGPENPLGARAMYLGDSLYRIHGTNQPWSIGQAVSSGCIRMRNEDVIDLYERVGVGTRVVVS
jgi:lipoprotein-anchoring transpeptidase ErfK/SrfK